MKRIDRLIRGAARFVFGLGVGLALTSAVVIVSNGPAFDSKDVKPADVVQLDPIVVTISPRSFEAERAHPAPSLAAADGAGDDLVPPHFHPYGSGAQKV